MEKMKEDAFSIDPSNRHVLFKGEHVRLKPRSAALFILLYKSKGHVVPRQEITSKIWNNEEGVEDSLAKSVSEIRKLIKTCSQEQFISLETIYKVGYRFAVSSSAPIDINRSKQTRRKRIYRLLFIVLITLLTVIATVTIFFWIKRM